MTPQEWSGARLLVFNLATDIDHPVLGFTTYWVRELARRVGRVEVLTMQKGRLALPSNVRVHSVGLERGYSKPRRVVEFYKHLGGILREGPVAGCFSHMITVFSVLAAPVLRVRGVPLVSWYAHPSRTPTLRMAQWVSDRMVTSLPGSYPYRSSKVEVIGQGIDTALFAPARKPAEEEGLVLCVGRISPVKGHLTLVRALARVRRAWRLLIVGATTCREDEAYLDEVLATAARLQCGGRVTVAPAVPPDLLPGYFQRCAVHVNLTPKGFGDKVAWEAMSCGRPCVLANADFAGTLGRYQSALLFAPGDEAALAARVEAVLGWSAAERSLVGGYLRGQVEREHSLEGLAGRVLDVLGSCKGGGRS